ncbi:MAG: AzlD domain-containing protein [Coriobacteriia bacterium]|nr:AzlD domain-containing protein [Coriobacteriia bacterium]
MSERVAWAVIVGMALANFGVRFLPIAVVSRLRLPEPVHRWLSFVPVSVMASLVAVAVLRPEGGWALSPANPYVLAAVPTAAVYARTRSFLGATLAGVVLFVIARAALA